MSFRAVRWGGGVALVAALLLTTATPSFAPHVAQLQVSPAQARPGQEVTVFGPRGYGRTNPVEIRSGSVDGPILGTFQPNEELYAMWGPGTVTIPANAQPGAYTLFATQILAPSETHIRGVPARGELTVVGAGGPPVLGAPPVATFENQPTVGLIEDEPVGVGTILLVALGVGGVGLFLVGAAIAFAGRRRSAQPETSR